MLSSSKFINISGKSLCPMLEVREFAEKINLLSLEDKQWLLQQVNKLLLLP